MFPGSWVSIFSFFQQPLSKDAESSLFFLQFLGFRSPGKATGHSGRCSHITAPSGMLSLVETLPMLYGFGVILFLCPPGRAGSSNWEPIDSHKFTVSPTGIAGLTMLLYPFQWETRSDSPFPGSELACDLGDHLKLPVWVLALQISLVLLEWCSVVQRVQDHLLDKEGESFSQRTSLISWATRELQNHKLNIS